jgi:hypothetical protein
MKTYLIHNSRSKLVNQDGQPAVRNFNLFRCAERDIDELIGLCKGIVADRIVPQMKLSFCPNGSTHTEKHRICGQRIFSCQG